MVSLLQSSAASSVHAAHSDQPAGNKLLWSLIAILVVAFALGGGGSKYGLSNFVVQATALIALALHGAAFSNFWRSAPTALKLLIAATCLLPILYIIPLPATVWTALPGRELMAQSFELIGGKEWATISVDPIRTALAFTAVIVPIAVLTIGWNARRDQLVLGGWCIIGLGLLHFLIGVPQVLSSGQEWLLYPENEMPGVLFGAFANRNSGGLFLVAVLTLATVLPIPAKLAHVSLASRITICALLIVGIVLTRSRTALVLAALPLAFAFLRAVLWQMKRSKQTGVGSPRAKWLAFAPALALIVIVSGTLVVAPGRVNDALDRFNQTEDARSYVWEDAAYSAQRYWPVGSGTGTFDDVFQIDESLENMTLRRAGRAHNDYIEVTIEAGLPGLILVACWFALVAWLAWRARRSPQRWIAWSGSMILLVIALQSITDYPLRNLTMLSVAGFALLVLARFGAPPADGSQQEVLA